jgi:ribosomal protein L37AE/L43A
MADTEADADTDTPGDTDTGADVELEGATGATPQCPHCGSTDTERHSRFGSEVSAEQHYCNGCRTVFERIKYDGEVADTGR